MKRGRSGVGEGSGSDEVGTDGASPRTPMGAASCRRQEAPHPDGAASCRWQEAPNAGGGWGAASWGGDFNGNLVVYRGGDFGIICRR